MLPDSTALDTGAAPDGRLCAPSAERNIDPILEVLADVAPQRGRALEIASGTGQQIVRFAAARSQLEWQPSDAASERLESIRAWIRFAGLSNVRAPILLDAAGEWPAGLLPCDLVIAVNLLHLVTQEAVRAILANMAEALAPGGVFCLYGPFLRGGVFAGEGDRVFHAALKEQDPRIGYKDADRVEAALVCAGLEDIIRHEMPAANLMITARKPSVA